VGVAEARELGIADLLLESCAKGVPWVEMGFGPRNLIETTPQKEPFLTFCHPEMQQVLLAEAEQAGAQVRWSKRLNPAQTMRPLSSETLRQSGFQRAWRSAQMAADQQCANGHVLQHRKARNPFTLPGYF
jgi:hypothetical protein